MAVAMVVSACVVAGIVDTSFGATERASAHRTGVHAQPRALPRFPHNAPVSPVTRAEAARDRPDRFVAPKGTPPPLATLPTGTWKPLGPAPAPYQPVEGVPRYRAGAGLDGAPNSGRIDALVALSGGLHPGRVVAGSAGGGIWTSDDDGASWTPRTDQAPSLAIGSIAVDPANANHLIAGTGESHGFCIDCYYGMGILSSTDGGTTWSVQDPGSVFDGLSIAQVAIAPANPSLMFAASDNGLYRTTNGGTSWTLTAIPATNITAVVINPNSPGPIVYASTGTGKVYKSVNGGGTWNLFSTGLTGAGGCDSSTPSDTALAISVTKPATLYASLAVGLGPGTFAPVALCKTTNGGTNWTAVTVPDYTGDTYSYGGGCPPQCEQGAYDNVVAIDPTNVSHIIAGGETVVESTDGARTWTNVNGKTFGSSGANPLHPDQHALAFRPDGKVWIGNDGGVYLYDPSTGKVTNANGLGPKGLNITQFYFGDSAINSTVLAGAQDNQTAELQQPIRPPLYPWYSTSVDQGDGGPTARLINPDPNCVCEVDLVEADKQLDYTNDFWKHTYNFINSDNLINLANAPFTPPMVAIPNPSDWKNPTIFFGGSDLYRDNGASPDTWTQQTFVGTEVSAIAISPTNSQDVYVGFEDGTIQVSTDGGSNFTSLAKEPTASWVTGISVDPTNPQAITASFSASDTTSTQLTSAATLAGALPHVSQYVFNGDPTSGKWTVITGDLPSRAAVSHVIYDNGALVAATDLGVYGTAATNGPSTLWSKIGSGLPAVQVQDLSIDPSNGDLIAVTHGRGAWKLPKFGAVATAWGNAALGGLGNGQTSVSGGFCGPTCSDVPVYARNSANTALLKGPVSVAVGDATVLAVLNNGNAVAWGYNNTGQLGNGNTSNSDLPVSVCAVGASVPCGNNVLTGVKAVAAGHPTDDAISDLAGYSLAVLGNGTVAAWGFNGDGELGSGDANSTDVPESVCAVGAASPCGANVLGGVKAVAAGGNHSLALLSNTSVVAWGLNQNGQLGNGLNGGPAGTCQGGDVCKQTPVAVCAVGAVWPCGANLLKGVTAIAAGGDHSLALLSTGAVVAWGHNNSGQLGNGTNADSDVPVTVSLPAGTKATAIAAGDGISMALLSNGTVMTWGDSTFGQLGNGQSGNGSFSNVPVQVCAEGATVPCGTSILQGATAIAAGRSYDLAAVRNPTGEGLLKAWGQDGEGQLGTGNAFDQSTPVSVCNAFATTFTCNGADELSGVTSLAGGALNSAAVLG